MSILPDWNNEPEQCLIAQNIEAKKLLNNPLLQKDTWRTIEDLGLTVKQHKKILTINFEHIQQDWLKLLVKLYVLIRSQRKISVGYICQNVMYLKKFSYFLEEQFIFTPKQINNDLFDEFEYYLKCSGVSPDAIKLNYITLKSFFDLCRQEKWLDINTYWFKNRCQKTKRENDQIEYIPEEVWQQLDEHLHHLPEPLQRMVLLIRGTGLRIGELLNLPLDCLRKRDKQWRLRLLTEKYKVEDELPIAEELVVIIKEQQEYIRKQFAEKYNNLFSSHKNRNNGQYLPLAKVMNCGTFNNRLNKLAVQHNICTKEGKLWKFKSHQFRKTVATVMTNAGVRDLIIQKYLRHRSLDMQNYYKHLLKQVIGDEYQELMKETKYVDSTGKIVATHKPNNPITELMRRKMYQITTQYGGCYRKILKSPCQTVNACWGCKDWLTSSDDLDFLKDDLERVETELEIAQKLGLVRQQKGLVSNQQSLKIRIQGLEQD